MQNRKIYVRSLHVLARNHLLNVANISSLLIKVMLQKKDIILLTKYVIDQQDIEILKNCMFKEGKISKFRLARYARS